MLRLRWAILILAYKSFMMLPYRLQCLLWKSQWYAACLRCCKFQNFDDFKRT